MSDLKEQKELMDYKHELDLELIQKQKELAAYKHGLKLERLRIKSAEIRRSQERRYGGK